MPIMREDVLKIAELAKLHFGEDELAEFTGQFQRILDYIEKLREVDVGGVVPTDHVFMTEDAGRQAWREDEVLPSLSPEAALGNAPDSGRGHFRVPRAIAFQP